MAVIFMQKNTKKILLTGGGTGGSVAPLLAIIEEAEPLRLQSNRRGLASNAFLWLGTRNGLEREMVEKENIKFKAISGGKLRRYFSWRNFIDPFFILAGFLQAFFIILKWKPDLVMSAGSFVSVPVVWAAWLLSVPVLIHQQDARPGLANKLMARFASIITVTFEKSLADYGNKAVWTGNPIRLRLIENRKQKTENRFDLKNDLPVVMVIGGGTGALAINKLVEQSLDELTEFCQIIHITGKNKILDIGYQILNYQQFEFLNSEQITEAYAVADIVVSRCGMGALTELSYLGKPAILIPIPDSHQEENAEIFKEKDAAIVLDQKELTAEKLVENIRKLLDDKVLRNKLSNNISQVIKRGANERIVKIIRQLINRQVDS